MQGAHSWNTDNAIFSEGGFAGSTVPTVPPFFAVIYLIKAK